MSICKKKYIDYLSKKYTWNKKQTKQMLRNCNKKRQKNVVLKNHTWANMKLKKEPNKYLQIYLPCTFPNTSKSTAHSVFPALLTAMFVYKVIMNLSLSVMYQNTDYRGNVHVLVPMPLYCAWTAAARASIYFAFYCIGFFFFAQKGSVQVFANVFTFTFWLFQ